MTLFEKSIFADVNKLSISTDDHPASGWAHLITGVLIGDTEKRNPWDHEAKIAAVLPQATNTSS